MPLTALNRIEAAQKYNIRAVILDVQHKDYSKGKMTRAIVMDENKTKTEVVGFQDVYDMCKQLKIGTTYVINDVIAELFNENIQLKFNQYSSIYSSSVSVQMDSVKIESVSEMAPGEFVNITAIVQEFSTDKKQTKSGSFSRQIVLCDPSGCIDVSLFQQASDEVFCVGDVVTMRGKVANYGGLHVFVPMTKTSAEELKSWWASEGKTAPKRAKQSSVMSIAAINEDTIGKRIDIECIVVSESFVSKTPSGQDKKVILVADSSNTSITTTVFGEGCNKEFKTGDAVSITATVGEYNKFSLTTNVELITDIVNAENKLKLSTWWETAIVDSLIALSDTALPPICTIADAVSNSYDRVSIKGSIDKLTDGTDVLVDSNGDNVPIKKHNSYTTAFADTGMVMIRNAIFSANPPCLTIFKNSVRTESMNTTNAATKGEGQLMNFLSKN